ncbi:Outer membrane protein beta-barrel domain-containing protein [Hymenobacter gelipurpurascens]|uniref:Outer membrane protein beta-barrel domain-containing protein n=1 Tax=Hymenobacter gelipurpurascens TaxID=89968 RepID=A0A212UD45_9BACT|nr:porin family protein [Hymenobacter gelipurpurascens]SNC76113.1 Outer membrane protein beta-barrel domain-containing protein [Hymenobacter gelipurpurascens]
MKKAALLLSLCALSTAAVAQTEGPRAGGIASSTDYSPGTSDSRNNGFGVKGGFTASNFRGDDKKNFGNEGIYNTFHAGVYSQFGFNDKFSIQPEILYSRQGFKGSNPANTAQTGSYTTRLDYLQVPVLLVYNFLDNVSVHVGPQVSLLTKVKEGDRERKIADDNNVYGYSYNSLDYGLAAGLEARVGPARVGGRYTAGFADIIQDQDLSKTGTKTVSAIKNGMFQVYLGLGISN